MHAITDRRRVAPAHDAKQWLILRAALSRYNAPGRLDLLDRVAAAQASFRTGENPTLLLTPYEERLAVGALANLMLIVQTPGVIDVARDMRDALLVGAR